MRDNLANPCYNSCIAGMELAGALQRPSWDGWSFGSTPNSSNSRSAQSLGAQIRNKTSPNKRANKGHKFIDKTPRYQNLCQLIDKTFCRL